MTRIAAVVASLAILSNCSAAVAAAAAQQLKLSATGGASEEPRITVTYLDAEISDVIAAFALFSGRSIVVGKDVQGTVTAEIRNEPWDVAFRAILHAQGLAAAEDGISRIISVDSYRNIASRQASEPLITRMVPVNYASAGSLAAILQGLLTRECAIGGNPPANASQSCMTRGAVSADTATNTLIITETKSKMTDMLTYAGNLDMRTPQVAIKARIVFVNRTAIEELGLSYDLGTGSVPKAPGEGEAMNGEHVMLGGGALSAIANANSRVVNPALALVFAATVGRFRLTSFLDALREVRLAELQAEPSIVTLDNRRAEILVGQEIPIRVLDAGSYGGQTGQTPVQGSTITPRATVQLKEVGIILRVTPHITSNRQVLLELHAENSDAQLASSDVGFIFAKQRADNQLLVADGETAVIGGLTVNNLTSSKSGIPFLADLPVVGRLFGVTRRLEQKRDLLILVTPHIIDGGAMVQTRPNGTFAQDPSYHIP